MISFSRKIVSSKVEDLENFGNVPGREIDTFGNFVQWVIEQAISPSLRIFQEASNAIEHAIAYRNTCIDALITGMEELEFGLEVAQFDSSHMIWRRKLKILGWIWSAGTVPNCRLQIANIQELAREGQWKLASF
jgi:hypothetical protein